MDWNAFSAVATAFATLAALVIAARTEHISRRSAVKLAGLHAASYIAQLTDVVENASRVITELGLRKTEFAAFERFPTLLPARWENAIGVLKAEALTHLEALPNNAAYRAAEAIGAFRAVTHELREFEEGKAGWNQMDAKVRMSHLERFQNVFHKAHVTLRAALQDFQHAAKSQTKPLSLEEQGFVID